MKPETAEWVAKAEGDMATARREAASAIREVSRGILGA